MQVTYVSRIVASAISPLLALALMGSTAFAAGATPTASTGTTSLQELQAQLTADLAALQQEEQLIMQDLQTLVTAMQSANTTASTTTNTGTATTTPQSISSLSLNGRVFSETNGVWSRWNGSKWVTVNSKHTLKQLKRAAAKQCSGTGSANCIVTASTPSTGSGATPTGSTASTGTATGSTPTGSTASTGGTGATTTTPVGTTASGGESGNSNNGSTTDTSNSSGNTGGGTTSTGTTGSSGAASGTGMGGSTAGSTSTSTPNDPGTGVTAGSTTTCSANMSLSGTTIPSAAMITDCQGNSWTLAGGIPSLNQNQAGTLTTVSLLLAYNGNIYAEDAGNAWWQWNSATASWIKLNADPRMSAGGGTTTTTSGGCGSANGTDSATAPTTNLCTTGTASTITSATGSWNWSCTGSGGGTVSQCFALKPGNATGTFSVAGGQIIDPSGKTFIGRGINLYDFDANGAAGAVTQLFPGINIIRLACENGYDADSPGALQDFITQMTSQKIVVVIEDHSGISKPPYTGGALQSETNWYASLAAAFANNPYVWFGTFNEPGNGTNLAGIADQEVAIYNAIRGAGSNTLVLMEEPSGGNPGLVGANASGYDGAGPMPPSDYATMHNIVWDLHYYGWVSKYSTDQATVAAALMGSASGAQGILGAQTITSADGTVPVIIGEYGDSTTGEDIDANGMQVVQAVINSGYGSTAWNFNSCCAGDKLTNGGSSLTSPYGQTVAQFISGR